MDDATIFKLVDVIVDTKLYITDVSKQKLTKHFFSANNYSFPERYPIKPQKIAT